MEDTAAAVETPVTVSTFGVSRHPDTARLVLSSPKPPGVREEFVGVVRKAFRPRASGGGGAGRTPPARWGWALTALQTVFPVLQWGRTYNFKLFRSDVMAGLTLASLGIPQVRSNFYFFLYPSHNTVAVTSITEKQLQTDFVLTPLMISTASKTWSLKNHDRCRRFVKKKKK